MVGPTKFPFSNPGTTILRPSKIQLAPSSIPDWTNLLIRFLASGEMTGPRSASAMWPWTRKTIRRISSTWNRIKEFQLWIIHLQIEGTQSLVFHLACMEYSRAYLRSLWVSWLAQQDRESSWQTRQQRGPCSKPCNVDRQRQKRHQPAMMTNNLLNSDSNMLGLLYDLVKLPADWGCFLY